MAKTSTSFKKGEAKGRPKGVENKTTKTLKEFLVYISENGKEKMWQEMQTLKGKLYVDAYLSLIEYVQPKLARTEVNSSGEITTIVKVVDDTE